MKKSRTVQLTIRGVPDRVNARLREQVKREGRSLNAVAVEALARGVGLSADEVRYTDLDDLAGTWVADATVDRALSEMDVVDDESWK